MKKILTVYYILLSVACIFCCINFWGLLILPSFFFFPLMFKNVFQNDVNSLNGEINRKKQEYNHLCASINEKTLAYNNIIKKSSEIKKCFCRPSMSGEDYERYVAFVLICGGYELLNFTQTTGDFGVDIVMINPQKERVAIQCKCYNNSVGEDAVREVLAGLNMYGCSKGMVCTSASHYTEKAIQLAQANGITLMKISI